MGQGYRSGIGVRHGTIFETDETTLQKLLDYGQVR